MYAKSKTSDGQPKKNKNFTNINLHETAHNNTNPHTLHIHEWMTMYQAPPPVFRTQPIPSRPGRRNRTRPCVDAVADDNHYTYLEYDNDPVQHYDDIVKTEINIIYLNRDSFPSMQP